MALKTFRMVYDVKQSHLDKGSRWSESCPHALAIADALKDYDITIGHLPPSEEDPLEVVVDGSGTVMVGSISGWQLIGRIPDRAVKWIKRWDKDYWTTDNSISGWQMVAATPTEDERSKFRPGRFTLTWQWDEKEDC